MIKAVTKFKATNSVFKITDKNNAFSITRPDHGISENNEERINKPNELLELTFQNDIELHVTENEKEAPKQK